MEAARKMHSFGINTERKILFGRQTSCMEYPSKKSLETNMCDCGMGSAGSVLDSFVYSYCGHGNELLSSSVDVFFRPSERFWLLRKHPMLRSIELQILPQV